MHKLVIASNHGGARETVIGDETGVLTTPGDPDALAAAITALLAKPKEERHKMGRAARARIGREFSAAALKRATLGVYKTALKSRDK